MFTLKRRKVKDKLDSLGRDLGARFQSAGIELIPHLSDDHPSLWNKKKVDTQWLFFSRNEAAQKEISEIIDTERTLAATLADPTPLYRHIFIGVSLDQKWLEIGVRIHFDAWVDRRNMLALLGDTARRDAFVALCQQNLSDDVGIGLTGNELLPISALNNSSIAELVAAFEQNHGWFFIGHRFDVAAAAAAGESISEIISTGAQKLLSVYRFLAWAPDNDAISMDRIVAEKHELREAHLREFAHEQSERETSRAEEQSEKQRLRLEEEQKIRDDQVWRERERAIRRSQAIARAEEEHRSAEARRSETPTAPVRTEAVKTDEPDGNVMPAGIVLPSDEPSVASSQNENRQAAQPARPVMPPRAAQGSRPPQGSRPAQNTRSAQNTRPAGAPRPMQGSRPEQNSERPGSERRPTSGRPADAARPERSDRPKAALRPEPRRDTDRRPSSAEKPVAPKPNRPAVVSDKRREDIQVSDSVEVLNGFLKGRIGIVQSIDDKGELKVNFGALASRVPRKDVKGLGPAS